jgi:hypothetical protein
MANSNTQQPSNENAENPLMNKALSKKHFQFLITYTAALIVIFSWLFFNQLKNTPFLSKNQADSLLKNYPKSVIKPVMTDAVTKKTKTVNAEKRLSKDSIIDKQKNEVKESNSATNKVVLKIDYSNEIKDIMLSVLLLMLFCGILGGCLSNLRGFFYHHLYYGFFPKVKEIPYYVRPIMGALTGLFMFFVGSLFSSTMSYDSNTPLWTTITGSIPSLSFAFLAGFACLELMSRLKQIAESLFGYKTAIAPNTKNKNNQDEKIDLTNFDLTNLDLVTLMKTKSLSSTLAAPLAFESSKECKNPLSSLTDVFIITDLEADIILKVSNLVGQIAISTISLDNQLFDSQRDEFTILLGKGHDLVGNQLKTLRMTTLVIDNNEGATIAGMKVSINDTDYSSLCATLKDKKYSFFTDITFFQ